MKAKRAHSLGGCTTCRKRHLHCDQTLPRCGRCLASGLECNFTPALRWITSMGEDVYKQRVLSGSAEEPCSRRYLYTEQSRLAMIAAMDAEVPSSLSNALDSLESAVTTGGDDIDSQAGPFSVFSAASTATDHSLPTPNNVPRPPDFMQGLEKPLYDDPFQWEGFSFGSLDFLQWQDLFTWDLESSQFNTAAPPSPEASNPDPNTLQSLDASTSEGGGVESLLTSDDFVADAWLLIAHFRNVVIDQMGSLPINEKSAWVILNYPSAVFTLSRITPLGTPLSEIKHAEISNLLAVVAVSAFHISVNMKHFPSFERSEDYWTSLRSSTYEAAKHHLGLSLSQEADGPGKAKYKDQLMAMAAILATALLSVNTSDSWLYLTHMECLIRVRGISKPTISRRARLLHNIYAWMRIVSESTCIIDRPPAQTSPPLWKGGEIIGEKAFALDDFLQLERAKGPQTNEHDIHMESSLQGRDNMHSQLYGVPESWLRLVSQTTRLANVMDRLQVNERHVDAIKLSALQPRINLLENAVCQFQVTYGPDSINSSEGTPHAHMVRALASALVIFFYRRVRDVNALVLQGHVDSVIKGLHGFDNALVRHQRHGPGTAWPAFVAGAEALTVLQQGEFDKWLSSAATRSGWKGYQQARDILQEVWTGRDAHREGGKMKSWTEVCRSKGQWPILC